MSLHYGFMRRNKLEGRSKSAKREDSRGGTSRGCSAGDGDPTARIVGVRLGIEAAPALAVAERNVLPIGAIGSYRRHRNGTAWSATGSLHVYARLREG